jgi:hypothetical protein
VTERTRRGKLQNARSGKVIGGHHVNYGFRMNTARDAYEVDAPKMSVVRRTFRMIGEESLAITAVAKVLNKAARATWCTSGSLVPISGAPIGVYSRLHTLEEYRQLPRVLGPEGCQSPG